MLGLLLQIESVAGVGLAVDGFLELAEEGRFGKLSLIFDRTLAPAYHLFEVSFSKFAIEW